MTAIFTREDERQQLLRTAERLLEGPEKASDPFYQGRMDYLHEYAVASFQNRAVEFLRGENSWNQHQSDIWGKNCYYCSPSGFGSNDEDVIQGQCHCWCHELVPLEVLKERLSSKKLSVT